MGTVVPIPDKILPAVAQYVQHLKHEGHTHLFTTQSGSPITKSCYDKMWKRIISTMQAVSDQEIVKLTGHIFRHSE